MFLKQAWRKEKLKHPTESVVSKILRNVTWYMNIVLFFQVRLALQICILDHLLNKNCSMASEDIGQFKPYDTSKAYLSTAYGLRTKYVMVVIWVREVGLSGNLSPTSKALLRMLSNSDRDSFANCQLFCGPHPIKCYYESCMLEYPGY